MKENDDFANLAHEIMYGHKTPIATSVISNPSKSPRTNALWKPEPVALPKPNYNYHFADNFREDEYNFTRTLEIELGEAVRSEADCRQILELHAEEAIEWKRLHDISATSLRVALAQIAVKDEVLNEAVCEFAEYGDKYKLSGHQNLQLGKWKRALTNSPAAAKEILEQNERMKVASTELIAANEAMRVWTATAKTTEDVCSEVRTKCSRINLAVSALKQAISTTQPAKR